MHVRTFCNAFSMFALGTPSARAFLMTLNSVTFLSGSTDPPSNGGRTPWKRHKSQRIARAEWEVSSENTTLTAGGDHNVLDVIDPSSLGDCGVGDSATSRTTHARNSRVDLAATLIIDSFLLLDLRPLEEDAAREVNRSICNVDDRVLCCDRHKQVLKWTANEGGDKDRNLEIMFAAAARTLISKSGLRVHTHTRPEGREENFVGM